MRYKHISSLDKHEEIALFAASDDLVEDTIERVSDAYKEHEIDNNLIKEEFYKLLKSMDEVVDTKTYKRYKPIKQRR